MNVSEFYKCESLYFIFFTIYAHKTYTYEKQFILDYSFDLDFLEKNKLINYKSMGSSRIYSITARGLKLGKIISDFEKQTV